MVRPILERRARVWFTPCPHRALFGGPVRLARSNARLSLPRESKKNNPSRASLPVSQSITLTPLSPILLIRP
jgi:hypothetical protein